MRPGDTLHWTALLFGLVALFWALTAAPGLAGLAAGLALIGGLAAGIVGLLAALRLTGPSRAPALGGTTIALVAHALFVVAFVGANPINFKGEPGRGVNQDPPAVFAWLIDHVGTWIPILLFVAALLTFWMLWTMRERALAGGGLALVALVLVLSAAGVGQNSDAAGAFFQALFAIAFVALAAGCLLPLFVGDAWPGPEPA